MMQSKIPLPSKRSAQSSIPLPTKGLHKPLPPQTKKLQLNSKEIVASRKPLSVKQVLSKPSKVSEKDEKIAKRLPFKSHDFKKMAPSKPPSTKPSSTKPPSQLQDVKKVAGLRTKQTTENKIIKLTKPAPVKQPSRNVVPQSKFATGKENQPRRFSSLKPSNDKKAIFSSNKSGTANKTLLQPKIVNQTKKWTKNSDALKKNINRNPSVSEKVATVAPNKQTSLATKSGVDDSEFKGSRFFKSLILNERELSPGIIKMCSKNKFLSPGVNANKLQLLQESSPHIQSVDEFVEEVKRNSSKYFRFNGRLVLHSPYSLKVKEQSADDFVEEVKRNSARFHQRKGNLLMSPCPASRRWTCNVPNKPSIANMTSSELAAEMRRLSEIRRESGAQLLKKAAFSEQQYSMRKLNPHEKVLRDLECLTAKKRDKVKKKVTFLIPSGSPLLSLATKTEAKLSDISEGSSQSCTPELDLDCCKAKTNLQSEDSDKNAEDTSVLTTPELNLPVYKLNFDSSPKELNATFSFDVSHEDYKSTNNNSSDNETVSLKVAKGVSKNKTEQCPQNSCVNLNKFTDNFLSSKFSSFQISNNNVCSVKDSDLESASFENYLTNTDSNSYSEFSNLKSTDCLFQSGNRLTVPSIFSSTNETEKFCVNTERKIYTPHPVALHSRTNLLSSVSPSFLGGKFSTLNSYAPIYTPSVLKNLAQSPANLCDVRQRLDFNEKLNLFTERRESQIILQTIPTAQKMNDFLCDQECAILSSQFSEEGIFFRNLRNPIANILNNGDEMHFIPVYSPQHKGYSHASP